MAPYQIVLLTEGGAVHEERVIECAHDDEAIDRTGEIAHPYAIDVWQGERHVIRFPAWPRTIR